MTHATEDTGAIGFASVYDVLYGAGAPGSPAAANNAALLAAQMTYLHARLPSPPGRVLDAGCGTGRHLLPLARSGYRVIGLDASQAMLDRARAALDGAGERAGLVRGDLRHLPFHACFDAALCLESPLAYLHEDAALSDAFGSLHRALRAGGRLIMDVFDYPAALGERPFSPVVTRFPTAWGEVKVHETHHYRREDHIWHMHQVFTVTHGREIEMFAVDHALRIRTAAAYATAAEAAGFMVEELLPAYPETFPALRDERRILLVAVAHRAA